MEFQRRGIVYCSIRPLPLLATKVPTFKCTYNGNGISLAGISFNPQSTAELELPLVGNKITITGTVTMAGGKVTGLGHIYFANNSTFTWTGGTIDNAFDLGDAQGINVTTTISGAGTKKLPGFIFNYGTITWTDSGRIDMATLGSISNYGTFDIRGDGTIAGASGWVANSGTFKKTLGTGTTTINSTAHLDLDFLIFVSSPPERRCSEGSQG